MEKNIFLKLIATGGHHSMTSRNEWQIISALTSSLPSSMHGLDLGPSLGGGQLYQAYAPFLCPYPSCSAEIDSLLNSFTALLELGNPMFV